MSVHFLHENSPDKQERDISPNKIRGFAFKPYKKNMEEYEKVQSAKEDLGDHR